MCQQGFMNEGYYNVISNGSNGEDLLPGNSYVARDINTI